VDSGKVRIFASKTKKMAAHNELGKWGEDLAAEYLEKKGYTIVERDWKSGRRDIDIIALDDDVVVFVEVKTRRNSLYGQPEEAVDYHKLQSLQQAINHYVRFKHIRQEIRFDIISIVGTIGTEPDIQHFQNVALL
jgi:putative endonuclease